MTDIDWVNPCKTRTIRDNFAAHVKRKSVLPGVDFACDTGDKVFAAADGRVVLADGNADQVRGKNIVIRHQNGSQSHYLHLSKVLVSNGDQVKAGETIGLSGNTGTTSTGPHLHFSIKKRSGECIDPEALLRKERKEARQERRESVGVDGSPIVDTATGPADTTI